MTAIIDMAYSTKNQLIKELKLNDDQKKILDILYSRTNVSKKYNMTAISMMMATGASCFSGTIGKELEYEGEKIDNAIALHVNGMLYKGIIIIEYYNNNDIVLTIGDTFDEKNEHHCTAKNLAEKIYILTETGDMNNAQYLNSLKTEDPDAYQLINICKQRPDANVLMF